MSPSCISSCETEVSLLLKRIGCARRRYRVRGILRLDTRTLEEEADRLHFLALSVAERAHELLQPGVPLYLEEDLVVVIRHLDVEVLGGSAISIAVVGHGRRLTDGESQSFSLPWFVAE